MCCYSMFHRGFAPATIINVGVGSCPEEAIWEWMLPNVPRVGIDARLNRRWKAEYVKAIVSDHEGQAIYCGACRSASCQTPEKHGRMHLCPTVTIDSVAAGRPKPFFIWMDIEGGELAALRGAEHTLPYTGFLNVELQDDHCAGDGHSKAVHEFLEARGFRLYHRHEHSCNVLYQNRRLRRE